MPQENAVLQKVLTTENQWKEMFQPAVPFSASGNNNKIGNGDNSIYTPDIADFLPTFSSLLRPNTTTKTLTNTKEQKYENTLLQSQTKTDQTFPKKLQFDTTSLEKAMRGAIRQGVQDVPFQNITKELDHTEWRTTRQLQAQSQKESTPIVINRPNDKTTQNLSPVHLPVQTDLSVKLQNQSTVSDGNIKVTISEVKNKIEQEIQKQDVRGKILTSFEIEPQKDCFGQIENTIMEFPELDQIEKTVNIAVTGEPEINNSVDISSFDFGIPETKNESVTFLLEGNKEIANQLNIMAEEFGIAPSVMQTIAVELLGKAFPQQTEKPQAVSFGIPSEIEQIIGINLTGQKNIMNSVSVSASDFGVPSSIYKSVAVHLTPYVTMGNASLGSLRKARGGIVGKNGAMGFADGGMVRGGPQLITVAEEGTPEMIIPLGSQRRQRAVQLWEKTGHILGVPGFVNGGIVSPHGQIKETFISHKENDFNRENSAIYAPIITDNISSINAPIKELFANITETFTTHMRHSLFEQDSSIETPNYFSSINEKIKEIFKNISQNIEMYIGKDRIGGNSLIYISSLQDQFSLIYQKTISSLEATQVKNKNVLEKQNQFSTQKESGQYDYPYTNTEKILYFSNTALQNRDNKKTSFFATENEKLFQEKSKVSVFYSIAERILSLEYKKQNENQNTIFFSETKEKPFMSSETISQSKKTFSHIMPMIPQNQTGAPPSITIGNITFQIEMNGENNDLLSSIENQKEKIADCIAQVISQALKEKFENTPLRGGQTA